LERKIGSVPHSWETLLSRTNDGPEENDLLRELPVVSLLGAAAAAAEEFLRDFSSACKNPTEPAIAATSEALRVRLLLRPSLRRTNSRHEEEEEEEEADAATAATAAISEALRVRLSPPPAPPPTSARITSRDDGQQQNDDEGGEGGEQDSDRICGLDAKTPTPILKLALLVQLSLLLQIRMLRLKRTFLPPVKKNLESTNTRSNNLSLFHLRAEKLRHGES
jgi:hypothetical protein